MTILRILVILIGAMGLMDCGRMKSAEVQFHKITMAFNPAYLDFCNFFITPDSNGRSFELRAMLIRNMSSDVHVAVDFLMKGTQDEKYKLIFVYDFDLCKLWDGLMQQSIARMWFKNLKKFSNFPNTCPFLSGYYYIKKMKVDTKSVPMFVLSGQYMVKVSMYEKKGNLKDYLTNSSMELRLTKP